MGRVISSDEPIHNLSDAEAMLRQLEEHHVVMESREETFTRLLETGEKMIEDGHFASEEVTPTRTRRHGSTRERASE